MFALSILAIGHLIADSYRNNSERPNVLFIVVDDLGMRDLSSYGSSFYETPNIDALAKSGMLFTDAYSANPLCSPTRASILTGQYPVRHGLTTAGGHIPKLSEHKERQRGPEELRGLGPAPLNYLDPKHYTLGEAMKDAGYATAFFGKWHMGCRMEHWPESNGFDYVKGGRQHPGPPGKKHKRKFFPPWDCDTLKPYPSEDTHVDDYITDLTIDYMKEQKAAGKPFFICHWPYSVHAPFQSKPDLIKKWRKKVDPDNPQRSPTMAAMIEVLDENMGRLMQALDDNGLADNTIVIFTSDNGGNMYDTVDGTTPTNNAPLRSGKGNNYEGGVRIPMIVRWPGVIQPGTVCMSVVSSVDHYPAILEMTHQKQRPEDHMDGVSYLPALKGEAFDRGPILCDMPHPVWATSNVPNTFIRDGDWKLFRFWYDDASNGTFKHRYELYQLRKDIGETRNLADAHPEKVQQMAAMMDRYYKATGVLGYNANLDYNHRSVGTWFGTSDKGKLSANNGALQIQSDGTDYTVKNRFFPTGARDGFLIFEAKSSTGAALKFAGKGSGSVVKLTNQWKSYALSGSRIYIDRNNFLLSLDGKGTAELRNVHVTTADKTVMTQYKFY